MLHFLLEEKAVLSVTFKLVLIPYFFFRAISVALFPSSVAIISSTFILLLSTTVSTTSIVPSVMVPVLSRHSTSVHDSISIPCNFWISTFFLAIFNTPAVKAIEVSKTKPSGIIPIIPATVDSIASL